jgi:hypothetical protein
MVQVLGALVKEFAANRGSLPTRFAVLVSAIRPEANSKISSFFSARLRATIPNAVNDDIGIEFKGS